MVKSEKNKDPFKLRKNSYTNGFLDGERNIIKKLFTLEIITIEKIAEISKLSIEEIQKLTKLN